MADANKEFEPKGEDEIRQEVIEEYNFDADSDKERIEKMTKSKLEAQEKLGTAIKQKQSNREDKETYEKRLKDAGIDPETGEKIVPKEEKKDGETEEEAARRKKDEGRDKELDDIKMEQAGDFDEEIQGEIRSYAKMHEVSYKEAAKSEYITFKVDKANAKAKAEDASMGGGKGNNHVDADELSDVEGKDYQNLSDEDWAKEKAKIQKGKGRKEKA